MLIVISGPDRVGKSTLIEQLCEVIEEPVFVQHHSAPPRDQDNIFDIYEEALNTWDMSGENHAIFDRAWPCTYILEQLRNRNAGFMEELVDFEMWLQRRGTKVVHVGQFRPWHWSAPHHLVEIDREMSDKPQWAKRAEYLTRMQEHEQYSQQLVDFYERITMFPNIQLSQTPDPYQLLERVNES